MNKTARNESNIEPILIKGYCITNVKQKQRTFDLAVPYTNYSYLKNNSEIIRDEIQNVIMSCKAPAKGKFKGAYIHGFEIQNLDASKLKDQAKESNFFFTFNICNFAYIRKRTNERIKIILFNSESYYDQFRAILVNSLNYAESPEEFYDEINKFVNRFQANNWAIFV